MPLAELGLIAVDSMLVLLALLVQIVIYPAFPWITPDRFREWHGSYTAAIGRIVAPLMFLQLGLSLWAFGAMPLALAAPALGGVVLAWIVTFFGAVPIHRDFAQTGPKAAPLTRLLLWNACRLAGWSLSLACHFAAVLRGG